jgi:hypothetical protein
MPRVKKSKASLLNETISEKENPKPRRVRFRKDGKSGKCYAVGRTRLMGIHPFIDRFLLKRLTETTASELRLYSQQPCASFVNIDTDESKRGPPQKNKFAIGDRFHRQWKTAIKSLVKRQVNKRKKTTTNQPTKITRPLRIHPWVKTVLSVIQNPMPHGLGYRVVDAEMLVAWKEARIGTELDGVAVADSFHGSRHVVIIELKTNKPAGYASTPVYEFTDEFRRLSGISVRRGITQCEADLWQALCGKVLLGEFAKRWPSKNFPSDLKFVDVLVVHSATPKQADAYRVPKWMAELTPALMKLMQTAMRDRPSL